MLTTKTGLQPVTPNLPAKAGRCLAGISDTTFYKWRSKYGGMTVSDAKRLKAMEGENAKLKRLLAEQMLDNATLKEILASESPSAISSRVS